MSKLVSNNAKSLNAREGVDGEEASVLNKSDKGNAINFGSSPKDLADINKKEDKKDGSKLSKISQLVKKILDCCKE